MAKTKSISSIYPTKNVPSTMPYPHKGGVRVGGHKGDILGTMTKGE
ncbi:uncharacterized protein METZ01_LOCUS495575, partial [marine metagenome]